jgi:outer membrane protein OmpA-like peptidoglycan-associated protein
MNNPFKKSIFAIILLLVGNLGLSAQSEIIHLENPSFEDQPRAGYQPSGWIDCGFPGETPPDVQPFGGFGVTQVAQDKNTYIGLVVRDNKTWESVGQKLSRPIRKGQCYKFTIQLARSDRYVSPTRIQPNDLTNFERGCVLRLYGGNTSKDKAELLSSSEVVENTSWKEYEFEFTARNSDYTYFFLEAYYKTPTMFHYNGNILLDNASPIYSCNITDPLLAENNKTNKINEKPVDPNKNLKTDNNVKNGTVKEENRGVFNPELKASELKVGYTFQLENLYFMADSSTISNNAERVIFKLLQFMKNNPTVSIEIGGHTNSLPAHEYCDKLSSDRAKNVAEFLVKNGIDRKRISSKGYGKRKPIADNETELGKQRNQRVEVKITDLD